MHAACPPRPPSHLIHSFCSPPPSSDGLRSSPSAPPPRHSFSPAGRFIIPPPRHHLYRAHRHTHPLPNLPIQPAKSHRARTNPEEKFPACSSAEMAVSSGMAAAAFSVRPPAPAHAARPCACAAAAGGARMRASAGGGDGGAAKWWAPLLGWSGQPDYIDAQPTAAAEEEARHHQQHQHQEARAGAAARRFGVLTEDKARQLRMRMMETESFHDAMYHSAIASRLASASPDVDKH